MKNPILLECFLEVEKKIEKELDGADMCVDKLDCRPRLFEFGEKSK